MMIFLKATGDWVSGSKIMFLYDFWFELGWKPRGVACTVSEVLQLKCFWWTDISLTLSQLTVQLSRRSTNIHAWKVRVGTGLERAWILDLQITSLLLYQLSYRTIPIHQKQLLCTIIPLIRCLISQKPLTCTSGVSWSHSALNLATLVASPLTCTALIEIITKLMRSRTRIEWLHFTSHAECENNLFF